MFFNFSVLFSALLFLCGLELIVFQNEWVFVTAAAIAFVTLQAAKKFGKSFFSGIIPLVFGLSSVMILYLVDSFKQQQLLIILSFCAYYLAFLGIYRLRYYKRDQTARGLMAFAGMSTLFLFYAGAYGIYLNFAIPIGGLMLAYCIATALVSYQYFLIFDKEDARLARVYSLLLGLSLAEVAWVINFWPFGYLTTGVVVLMFYYLLWYMVQSYFLKTLSKKYILAHTVLFVFLIGMVLTSTRWLPVS